MAKYNFVLTLAAEATWIGVGRTAEERTAYNDYIATRMLNTSVNAINSAAISKLGGNIILKQDQANALVAVQHSDGTELASFAATQIPDELFSTGIDSNGIQLCTEADWITSGGTTESYATFAANMVAGNIDGKSLASLLSYLLSEVPFNCTVQNDQADETVSVLSADESVELVVISVESTPAEMFK